MSVEVSVIIVNYNVKAFLQQCLYAVYEAGKQIKTEVFVVDNNSVDASLEMVSEYFPKVNIIANKENKGFAYACNQAIKKSAGKYILLLNPDTVIEADSLRLCFEFMEETKDAGALGVKMINGKGQFLPESKRSLPDAKSAFFKVFGLSKIFPKSRLFGKYQLKYLNENEIHQIEVLSGAFMFIRKTVLDRIGLLDESFFMYGEDIDLSYRISKANFKNYYFPKTTIIHYKGESTKKASFKYVMIFYQAMLIFASKHYQGRRHFFFRLLISLAIYFRASLSIIKRIVSAIYLPIIDFVLIYSGYLIIVPCWESLKFSGNKVYSSDLLYFFIPVYIIIWQIFIFYLTKYRYQTNIRPLVTAILIGTVSILTLYSLLPENLRYSRALIIFGAALFLLISITDRLFIRLLKNKGKGIAISIKKRALLIGSSDNVEFSNYPAELDRQFEICNTLEFDNKALNKTDFMNQLVENIKIYKIETLIFFIKTLSISDIINIIIGLHGKKPEFKIILPENNALLGPQSVIDLQKLPNFKLNLISQPLNRLLKRIFDIIMVFIFFICSPILMIKNNPKIYFVLLWRILIGKYTWVSYYRKKAIHVKDLPKLDPGIFTLPADNFSDKQIQQLNLNYAKDYQIIKDIIIIFKALKSSLNLQYPINN